MENTGCSGEEDTLSCLRNVDYVELQVAIAKSPSFFSYQSLNLAWQPHVDGQVLLRNGMKYIQEGKYANVRGPDRLTCTMEPMDLGLRLLGAGNNWGLLR